MSYVCPICNVQPSSHSLTKIAHINEVVYYYTCPSKAILYYDVSGIINHYDGVLSEIPETKEWVWIFDSTDFGIMHASQTTVAIELARLISNKFSYNLKKIIIINPTLYVSIMHDLLLPFLNKKIKNIIEINYSLQSVEEVMKMV
jgi:hypothetical protein